MKILIIFLVTATSSIVQAQFINGFAPLEVGNFWIYQDVNSPKVRYTIEKDSLFEDSLRYYQLSYSHIPGAYSYYRLTENGFYARRQDSTYPEPNHEFSYYKNHAIAGDYWFQTAPGDTSSKWHFTVMDTITMNVFGKIVQVKFITLDDSSGLWGFWQWWTDEFGMIFQEQQPGNLVMRGCYVNGIAYGDTSLITSTDEYMFQLADFNLYQNYPNPFNPVTNILYEINHPGFVQLRIYDLLGKEIALLVSEYKISGRYTVQFNGGNFPSGVYFIKLISGGNFQIKKILLLR